MVADVAAIVADPDFRARVLKVGTVPRGGTPEEFAAAIDGQRDAGRGHPCSDGKRQAVSVVFAAARCLALAKTPEETPCAR